MLVPVAVPDALALRPSASVTVTVAVKLWIAFTVHVALALEPEAHPDQEYDKAPCPPLALAEKETMHGLLGLLG